MKKKKISFLFRVVKNNKTVQRYDSQSLRRFRNHIRRLKFLNRSYAVYLRVSYGNGFYNDGIYKNEKDLLFAIDAFSDPAIVDYLYG